MSFAHLHLHSQYSLLDGAIRIDDLIKRCQELGMPAVAITDHGNMFGAWEFYTKARAAGIKPILGVEVYVAPGSRLERESRERFHLTLLAMNNEGYRNLCCLVSESYRDGHYYKPRVDMELLEKYSAGVIALSGCLAGAIPKAILAKNMEMAELLARELALIFPGRFYLELQENKLADQAVVNGGLRLLHRKLDIPMVATNDCHYLTREDAYAHEVLLCIGTNSTIDNPDRFRFPNDEFYVKTPEEMAAAFKYAPAAIKNTLAIAEACNVELPFTQENYQFPPFEVEGMTQEAALGKLAWQGLVDRLGHLPADERPPYRERMKSELAMIRQMGFAGYFLIVSDFIRWAKDNGIPVGPGRGSAAGSLVAYALRITDIDPLPDGLLFERFLNPDRISMPDIDVDFCIYGREKVLDYVRAKYGEENVAQIITFGTLHARGAVRDVGRVLGMSFEETDAISKLISPTAQSLDEAAGESPELARLVSAPKHSKLFDLVHRLEGSIRHASTHAAGVVITPRPLTDYLPLYYDPKTRAAATQYSMEHLEHMGLVKLDFLGLKTLSVIDATIKAIRRRQPDFDLKTISLTDRRTFELLGKGLSVGVFQLESRGMQNLLMRLRPTTLADITAICALFRPGPLGSGMVDDFIQRKHGKKSITYDFPQLEPILKDTYGVIVYQEQVMQIAQALAGFTMPEADILRKAMGKKKPEEMAKQKDKFSAGCAEHGLTVEEREGLYDQIEKFAAYGFNKSHSAAYALLAYQTAYLKAHYPVEFMACLLTEDSGNEDKIKREEKAVKLMGITMRPPDINLSGRSFTPQGRSILYGFSAIKGLGEAAIEEILRARAERGFASLEDFCSRVSQRQVNRKVLEALLEAGALASLGGTDKASVERAIEMGQMQEALEAHGQLPLFEDAVPPKVEMPDRVDVYLPDGRPKHLIAIRVLIKRHPGPCPVVLHSADGQKAELPEGYRVMPGPFKKDIDVYMGSQV